MNAAAGAGAGRGMGGPLLLDGGVGTELQRLGVRVAAPWWTSIALRDPAGARALASVHRSFLRAGSQIVTANTFRANRSALARAGLDETGAHAMVGCAVSIARSAVAAVPEATALIAGSIAPAQDCYHPELVPGDAELRDEHAWLVRALVHAGVDLLLVETMNCVREAHVALTCATASGTETWVSFVCGPQGTRLLSGESLADAARMAQEAGARAVLVNCTSIEASARAAAVLQDVCWVDTGVYPNVEDRRDIPMGTHVERYLPPACEPHDFATGLAELARAHDLDVVGGCCGCTPAHIAALRARIRAEPGQTATLTR